MNRSRWKSLSLSTLVAWVALGCSSGQTKLDGAVFAGTVPVLKQATYDGQMGGTSYGDDPYETSKSQSWFFVTERPMDEVVAFYRKSLPGWATVEESYGDSPTVTFTGKPDGAQEGEYVQVICSPGKVQIHESYNAKRSKS